MTLPHFASGAPLGVSRRARGAALLFAGASACGLQACILFERFPAMADPSGTDEADARSDDAGETQEVAQDAGQTMDDSNTGNIWSVESAASTSTCATILGNSSDDNALFIGYPCLASAPPTLNQLFLESDLGDNFFTLEALSSGKCMTVEFGSLDDNTYIIQYDCNGAANQLFRLEQTADGSNNIVGRTSGKCVTIADADASSGPGLFQYTCTPGALNQEWNFTIFR